MIQNSNCSYEIFFYYWHKILYSFEKDWVEVHNLFKEVSKYHNIIFVKKFYQDIFVDEVFYQFWSLVQDNYEHGFEDSQDFKDGIILPENLSFLAYHFDKYPVILHLICILFEKRIISTVNLHIYKYGKSSIQ